MKARPILFSAPMVAALLEGRKTQTRRIINPQPPKPSAIRSCNYSDSTGYQPPGSNKKGYELIFDIETGTIKEIKHCPFGVAGDLLWVRETFCLESTYEYHHLARAPKDRPYKIVNYSDEGESFIIPHYRATEPEPNIVPYDLEDGLDDRTRWKPSIFMPRWASRLTLEITNIRAEELCWISEADAMEEGCVAGLGGARGEYEKLWNKIHGAGSSDENPWVWVIEFKVHECNIDHLIKLREDHPLMLVKDTIHDKLQPTESA